MFEALRENFTIVIVGSWNVSILSPEWVGKNIFGKKEVILEFGLGPELSRRLTVDDVVMIPNSARLTLALNVISDNNLKRMEEAACKILELLSHTPVSAVGINFGFRVKPLAESFPSISEILTKKLASENLTIEEHETIWKVGYERETKTILNLSVRMGKDEAVMKFNFHRNTATTREGIESIKEKVIVYRNKALSVLDNVFGVKSED